MAALVAFGPAQEISHEMKLSPAAQHKQQANKPGHRSRTGHAVRP